MDTKDPKKPTKPKSDPVEAAFDVLQSVIDKTEKPVGGQFEIMPDLD